MVGGAAEGSGTGIGVVRTTKGFNPQVPINTTLCLATVFDDASH